MKTLDVLRAIDLGNSVAEFDDALERYFVETESFRQIIMDRADIVAGDKGTGKTALFRILHKRYATIAELQQVEVVPAFNIEGNPVFQRLNEGEPLTEAQFGTLWKSYFLSLAGNWLLNIYETDLTDSMKELQAMLARTELLSADDSAATVFSRLVNLWKRLRAPKEVGVAATIGPEGIPIVVPTVTFADIEHVPNEQDLAYIPHDDVFRVLSRALSEVDLSIWLVLDRLDEAFAGQPDIEIPALRALLRTYLDLVPYEHVKLKLFLRRDLFRRVTVGGFVNLTHVNAKRIDITWDEDSLRDLLFRRLRENQDLLQLIECTADDSECLFATLLPPKVDAGDRKPITWKWIMSRVADGNEVRSPRNLIDLMRKTVDWSVRKEEREGNEYLTDSAILHGDAFKSGLRALSEQRINDTIVAEAGERALLIERFREGKAEHNLETVAAVLGLEGAELDGAVTFLTEIGFLSRSGTSFKVPFLYRDGLRITQGKAFDPQADPEDD